MLGLLACASSLTVEPDSAVTADAPTVTLSAPAAFDPLLGGPVPIDITGTDGEVTVSLTAPDGGIFTPAAWTGPLPLSVTWDGHSPDAPDHWLSAGEYTVTATRADDGTTASIAVHLVRAGFVAAYAEDDGGLTSMREPLYWDGSRDLQELSVAISRLDSLEDGTGAARDFPDVGAALDAPGQAEPVAYAAASRPMLTLTPGISELFGGSGLDGAEVGLRVAGWTVISGTPIADDVPVVIQRDVALSDTLGVVDETLSLTFTVGKTQLGIQYLPLRTYALLGPTTFENDDTKYHPWVAAIDPLLRDIAGTSLEHDAVVNATRDWIYDQADLAYDTKYGASAYTEYIDTNWTDAKFSFGAFLSRKYGSIINCTDCASILLTYANMLGADLHYAIILQDFDLNQILAIGGDEFSNCPFGQNGCGFSYHAITTADTAASNIWDATLSLDGDDDPGSRPSTELPVHAISGEEYLDRLVKSGRVAYRYHSQGTLQ